MQGSFVKQGGSYQSRDQVLCYVKHHLMMSSHHDLTDDSASQSLDEKVEPETELESYNDRE
eukprot:1134992-Pyramimonas_sp.AAC.1